MDKDRKIEVNISSGFIWRVVLILLALWFLYLIRDIIILLFVAVVISSAAQPVVGKLEKKKIPRAISTAFIYAVGIFFFGFGIYLIAPVIATEFHQLTQNIPKYFEGFNLFVNEITNLAANYNFESNLQSFTNNISDRAGDLVSGVFSNTFTFLGGILKALLVLSLSFYLLVKKEGIRGFIYNVTPKKHQAYVIDLVLRIQYKMGRWLIGQLALILIIFVLDFLVLYSLGVPYALTIALIGGLLEVIPYVGPILAVIPAALVGLTVSPLTAILIIVLYTIIQQVENYVLTPLIMKRAVGLDPVVIILALLIGGILAGVIGVIIAVPFATAVNVFLEDFLGEGKKAKGYENEPIET